MPNEDFTAQDAQNVILVCRNAPLRNMQEAEAVNALLAKFANWVNEKLAPPAAPPGAGPGPTPGPMMGDTRVPTRLAMITAGIAVDPRATDEELAAIGRVR
jgi:hypothetical protein